MPSGCSLAPATSTATNHQQQPQLQQQASQQSSLYEMPLPLAARDSLSEATAIRLFNSVVATDQPGASSFSPPIVRESISHSSAGESMKSASSINSLNAPLCRICRWNRSDQQLLECPCLCKGSVGYIHLQCLKRWILIRRDYNCEICNSSFNIPEERLNIKNMIKSFFSKRCLGAILKNILFSLSLVPLSHVILQQVLICMDNINTNPREPLPVKDLLVATFAILTSSALFFHFFEYITGRTLSTRAILRRWWLFGNSEEFFTMELGIDLSTMF